MEVRNQYHLNITTKVRKTETFPKENMNEKAKKVTVQVLGGEPTVCDCLSTVEDAFNELGLEGTYSATVNGEPADFSQVLEDFNYVCFSPAVKGGA